jgi:hypothetical protein
MRHQLPRSFTVPVPGLLSEMMDDPRNAVRSPRNTLVRSTAAFIGLVVLLVVIALGVNYVANNWRELIYGKAVAVTVINPEDGVPVMSNDMARTRGMLPLSANQLA